MKEKGRIFRFAMNSESFVENRNQLLPLEIPIKLVSEPNHLCYPKPATHHDDLFTLVFLLQTSFTIHTTNLHYDLLSILKVSHPSSFLPHFLFCSIPFLFSKKVFISIHLDSSEQKLFISSFPG